MNTNHSDSVGLAEFAALFRVTEKTARMWIRDGMPVLNHGTRGGGKERNKTTISLRASVAWYFKVHAFRLELDYQRTRLASEQADKTAMANAVERGELLRVSTVETEWGRLLANARAKLLGMPTKMAPQLAREKTPLKCRDLLTTEVRRVLTELSEYRAGANTDEADG